MVGESRRYAKSRKPEVGFQDFPQLIQGVIVRGSGDRKILGSLSLVFIATKVRKVTYSGLIGPSHIRCHGDRSVKSVYRVGGVKRVTSVYYSTNYEKTKTGRRLICTIFSFHLLIL
jgi:hypothetical protein